MATSPTHRSSLNTTWILLASLAVLGLIPLVFAALQGQGEAPAATLADAFCAETPTALAGIFLAETLLIAGLTAWAQLRPAQQNPLFDVLRSSGWHLAALWLLGTLPFIIAWQTESSVCTRGRAFFWESIFIEVFILAALAVSYNLIFGFAGVLSFGHAAFFGFGAYGVGLLMLHLEWPLGLAVIFTLTFSALVGLLISVIAVRIRGLYFAIFTLVFAEIFYVLAQNRIMADITGAEDGFTFPVPDWINATRNRMTFYYLALVFLIFCYVLVKRLINSPTGRVMTAMRENEDRALMLGFNTFWYKTLAIILAGVMASGAGILRGLLNKGASPNVLGTGFTIDPLLMTLVGGVSTFDGPVIGAFLLRLLEQSLRDAVITIGSVEINIGEYWALILGSIFILIVMVFPSGIVGTFRTLRTRWQAHRRPVEKTSPTPSGGD